MPLRGHIMKYAGQGKKEYIVIKFDDYLNDWRAFTKPVTINQAAWIIRDAPALKLDVVRIKSWNGEIPA